MAGKGKRKDKVTKSLEVLRREIQKKRVGLEIFEVINKDLLTLKILSREDGFLRNGELIHKTTERIMKYIDQLYNYMMNNIRKEDK